MGKKVILLRHGNTGFGGRYIGSRDVPLSPEGGARISELRPLFQQLQVDTVLSSPMLRCRQSFELLFSDRSPVYDEDLQEVDFGRWEGLDFSEICRMDPSLVRNWADSSSTFSFPEGECVANFVTRVHRAGSRLANSSHENIVVISHGGVIRTLICYFLKLETDHSLLFQVDKGNYASIDLHSEGGVLTGLNLGAR